MVRLRPRTATPACLAQAATRRDPSRHPAQASDTVYVANNNDGTVSVINGGLCNAAITSGCGSTSPTVTTGANPQFVAVDPSPARPS